MKTYITRCAICGINASTARCIRVTVPANQSEILSVWKDQCVKSLCFLLFDSEHRNVFLDYFELGSYCYDCYQLIRDINFTWNQLEEFKRRIKKQTDAVLTLLTRNYKNRRHKSDSEAIEKNISTLKEGWGDNSSAYSHSEIIEMIYSVTHSKRAKIKTNQYNSVVDPQELLEWGINVKEEPLESEFSNENVNSFDNDNENWPLGFPVAEKIIKSGITSGKKRTKIRETRNSSRSKRERLALKSNGTDSEELDSNQDFGYDDFQSNDEDWIPPPSANLRPRIVKESSTTSKKTAKKGRKYLKSRQITYSHKRKERVENMKSKGKPSKRHMLDLLQSDIILDASENPVLERMSKITIVPNFHLKNLEKAERDLGNKLSQYSRASIKRLQLPEEQENTILDIVRRIRTWERKQKYRQQNMVFFNCSKDNCKEKFKTEEALEGHVRGKHNGEKLPFYCTTCPRQFASYGRVRLHRIKRHQGVTLSFFHFCKICQKGYKTADELKSHGENAHQGPNPFCCAFCEEEYTTSLHLSIHVNKCHNVMELTPEHLENIQKLTCEKCGECFLSEFYFKRHLLSHESQTPKTSESFACSQCQKTCSSQKSLEYHLASYHIFVVCEICGKSVRKHSFTKHASRHAGERYECSICGRKFKGHSQLTDHERIHSGIRSYVCSVCGKAFFTKIVLAGHEKIHEPGYIPRKPFRRPRPKKKNIILEIPISEPRIGEGSDNWEVNYGKTEPSEAHNTVQQQQFISYSIQHPSGFVYPL